MSDDSDYDKHLVETNNDDSQNQLDTQSVLSSDHEDIKKPLKKIYRSTKQKIEREIQELKLYQANKNECISYVTLLRQALITYDQKLLDNVIQTDNVNIIRRTVLDVQPQYLETLIEELLKRLKSSPLRAREISLWFREIFSCYTAFCLSIPTIRKHIETLKLYIEYRLPYTSKLVRIQTQLDNMSSLALARIELLKSEENTIDPEDVPPLLYYNVEEQLSNKELLSCVIKPNDPNKDTNMKDNTKTNENLSEEENEESSLTDSFDDFMES